MKNFNEFLDSKSIKSIEGKTAEELADLHSEYTEVVQKNMLSLIESKATKADIENLKAEIIEHQAKRIEALNAVTKANNDALKEQGLALTKALKSTVNVGGIEVKSLEDSISEKQEDIVKSIESKGFQAELSVKTNYTRASVTNSTQALRLDSIGQLATRALRFRDIFNVVPVGGGSNGVVRYADWTTATRNAAMVAEAGAYPESAAVFQEYTLDLKKIGDSIPITEEALRDTPRFAAELDMFLRTNVSIVEDTQLYNGDGTGNNMTGAYTTAATYTPVASGFTDASLYDLIVKTAENITSGNGGKYVVNFAALNIVDINAMRLKKDANNNYIMPPFVDRSGNVVAGIQIIESSVVTANTMLMGDSRYGTIYQTDSINVTTGLVASQFTSDLMTLKARLTEGLLIRTADAGAFNKVTSISAALVLLDT